MINDWEKMKNEFRQIRAQFSENTIRVYQAYSKAIAEPAINKNTFVPPLFKMDRMTWIKPSFLWMMYRSGWGEKTGQEKILAIDILRSGFEWALANSCLSHFDSAIHKSNDHWLFEKEKSPVRIQWDPERNIYLEKLDYRSIQIGLSGEAVHRYVHQWIVKITDITEQCRLIKKRLDTNIDDAITMLPSEKPYKVPSEMASKLGLSP